MNTIRTKQILKNRISFFLVLLFTYVLLFEFILPVNKILPKPSLLLESIPALLEEYDLLTALAVTTTIIYLSLPIAYFIVKLISFPVSKIVANREMINNFRLFKNFSVFFLAVLFVFWFEASLFAELAFAVILTTFYLMIGFSKSASEVNQHYIDSAISLMIVDKKLHEKVVWKYVQPQLFNEMTRLHYYSWSLILLYEFIGGENGIGGIYNLALEYNDFSAIIMLAIIIALLIWLGNSIIKYFETKLVFWKV